MAIEKHMRASVIDALRPLHARAVENFVGPGTPDVNYIEGWVELKKIKAWPVREDTLVKVSHFTPQQRSWLATRCTLGGRAFMLIMIGRLYYLYDGLWAAHHIDRVTRSVMEQDALWSGPLSGLLEELQTNAHV